VGQLTSVFATSRHLCTTRKGYDLVFATEGGTPVDRNNVKLQHFRPILERSDIPAALEARGLPRFSYVIFGTPA
jgi:hypothetical protein